jgi:hypothetical protein
MPVTRRLPRQDPSCQESSAVPPADATGQRLGVALLHPLFTFSHYRCLCASKGGRRQQDCRHNLDLPRRRRCGCGGFRRLFFNCLLLSKSVSDSSHLGSVFYSIAMAASGIGSLLFGRLFDRTGLWILLPLTIIAAASAPLVFLRLLGGPHRFSPVRSGNGSARFNPRAPCLLGSGTAHCHSLVHERQKATVRNLADQEARPKLHARVYSALQFFLNSGCFSGVSDHTRVQLCPAATEDEDLEPFKGVNAGDAARRLGNLRTYELMAGCQNPLKPKKYISLMARSAGHFCLVMR